MKYNDYPDKYPNRIIEKLNTAYQNNLKTNVMAKENFEKSFFESKVETLVNKSVEISADCKCELEGIFVNILEQLQRCQCYFTELKQRDKKNKVQLNSLMQKTYENSVQIAGCCYENYNVSCDYYATHSRSFNACCANYCCCEIDIIDQLLCLCGRSCFPINRGELLKIINCRMDCLKFVFNNYTL